MRVKLRLPSETGFPRLFSVSARHIWKKPQRDNKTSSIAFLAKFRNKKAVVSVRPRSGLTTFYVLFSLLSIVLLKPCNFLSFFGLILFFFEKKEAFLSTFIWHRAQLVARTFSYQTNLFFAKLKTSHFLNIEFLMFSTRETQLATMPSFCNESPDLIRAQKNLRMQHLLLQEKSPTTEQTLRCQTQNQCCNFVQMSNASFQSWFALLGLKLWRGHTPNCSWPNHSKYWKPKTWTQAENLFWPSQDWKILQCRLSFLPWCDRPFFRVVFLPYMVWSQCRGCLYDLCLLSSAAKKGRVESFSFKPKRQISEKIQNWPAREKCNGFSCHL